MSFSPHLIARDSAANLISLQAPGIWGQKVLIVPRQLCSFRRIQLKGKSRSAVQAVKLRALKEAASHEDRLHIAKDRDGKLAGVWSFGSDLAHRGRMLPESLAREPMTDGLRLLSCLEGVEGQVWKDNSLLASRWWPSVPRETQWQTFLRAAQVDLEEYTTGQPALQEVPFRSDLPLIAFDLDQLSEVFSPTNLAFGGGFIACCVGLFLGAQYVRYALEASQTRGKIAQVSDTASQVLSQRRRALANMNRAHRFERLGDEARILLALDGLAEALSDQEPDLRLLQIRDDQLEVQLTDNPDLNGPAFVRQLESMRALSEVNVSSGTQNTIVVKASMQ
ncbi:MAG: hypothetical protein COA47_16425 [Robiginitomaculum sp.]|nr:MAG: hypothetical protein COA47_16425 [Robiginitomaculum sp.]